MYVNIIKKNRKYYAAKMKNGCKAKVVIDTYSANLELGEQELLLDNISVKTKWGADLIYKLRAPAEAQKEAGVTTLKSDIKYTPLVEKDTKRELETVLNMKAYPLVNGVPDMSNHPVCVSTYVGNTSVTVFVERENEYSCSYYVADKSGNKIALIVATTMVFNEKEFLAGLVGSEDFCHLTKEVVVETTEVNAKAA